jgi:hypothetical protein
VTRSQQLLSRFVDRELEFKYFCEMLDAAMKPILVVWAEGGLGKTWLLEKLAAECRQRGYCAVLVDQYHHVNYLGVFRAICEEVGPQYFQNFTKLADSFTGKDYNLNVNVSHTGNVNVLTSAEVERSELGDVAGVIVKDVHLPAPLGDLDMRESERMIRLTQQFVADFEGALSERHVVVFFDAAEKMPHVTREWLWDTVFGRFLAEARIDKARFVLAGREKPAYNHDLRFLVEERQLGPLDEQNIEAYLSRRGVSEEHRHELAVMLLATTGGQPNLIALHTDRYLTLKEGVPRDNLY